jgi:ABC-2 type transport system permease protein
MSTVYILWLRQIKRYLRSKSRIVGSLMQPILFLVALGYGFGSIYQKAGEGNYIEFLAPGIIGMSIIFTSVFSGLEVIWDRQFGFLKETLVAPVSRFSIMMGRTLGGATVATGQGLVVLVIAVIVGFRFDNFLVIPALVLVMMLTALLFTAIGTVIASFLDDMQGFHLIVSFLIMPLFFLSGALFPLQGVSKAISIVAMLNPLSYGVDAMRGLLTGQYYFGLGIDLAVLFCVAFVFLFVGSYSFSKMQA